MQTTSWWIKSNFDVVRFSESLDSCLKLVDFHSTHDRLTRLFVEIIEGLATFFEFLARLFPGVEKILLLQVHKILVMIHRLDNSLTAISIHLENFRSDNLLYSFWQAGIDVNPARLFNLRRLGGVMLPRSECAAARNIGQLILLSAHHHNGGSGFGCLLLEYLLRWLYLKNLTLYFPLSLPLLRTMHVFNDLGLPHLLLVCLLLPPNIILTQMVLTVFLLWLMIKITDLLA